MSLDPNVLEKKRREALDEFFETYEFEAPVVAHNGASWSGLFAEKVVFLEDPTGNGGDSVRRVLRVEFIPDSFVILEHSISGD